AKNSPKTCRNQMRRATSKLGVYSRRSSSAGLRFGCMSVLIICQFRIGDTEASVGRMLRLGREFPMKAQGTYIRRILIAHAVRQEGVVRDGHKIISGFAARPAKAEGVFADRSFSFKANVLQDNAVAHKGLPFPEAKTVAGLNLELC